MKRFAFFKLETLFVYGEIEVGEEDCDLIEIVLEADGEAAIVRGVRDPGVEEELVIC